MNRRTFITGLAAVAAALGLGKVAGVQNDVSPRREIWLADFGSDEDGNGSVHKPYKTPSRAMRDARAYRGDMVIFCEPITTVRTLYTGEWDINGGKMRQVEIVQWDDAEYFMYIDGELVPDAIIEVDGPGDMFISVRGYA